MLLSAMLLPVCALSLLAAGPEKPYDRAEAKTKYQRPATIPHPKDNAPTAERERLGRTLFFDPRLSRSGWISCGTCHNPALSWGDGLPRGIGHGMQTLGRRTPTVLNLAWAELLFWDGRAESLEEQALGPVQAPGEMNMPLDQMLARVRAIPGYVALFAAAYPGEGITGKTVGKAIANFERTIVSAKAPFDRWIEGDENAVSAEAKHGFDLFNGKANCAACHSGWSLTDHGFHDIGIKTADVGRGKLLPLEAMQYAHKTPTLRNVDHRAPYLHDGTAATLEDVIELYDRGGEVARPSLSPEVRKLNLTAGEKKALLVFLKTLTSNDVPPPLPVLPR
jgi:cytochrome c peroxidase